MIRQGKLNAVFEHRYGLGKYRQNTIQKLDTKAFFRFSVRRKIKVITYNP